MPIQLNNENDGILVVHVTGTLVRADYAAFVPEFERILRLHGKPRVLFDMTGLHGWDAGAMWEDIKFDIKHFADIERLAVLGEKKWQQNMTAFFKPFTKAIIQYFDRADAAAARHWLEESIPQVAKPAAESTQNLRARRTMNKADYGHLPVPGE